MTTGLCADDILGIVAPWVSPALVPDEALRRLRGEARAWPVTTEMGFECRLGDGPARADLGLCTRSAGAERARLAESLHDGPLGDVLTAFAGGDGFIASRVRNVCFEIDLAGDPTPAGLFAGLWHPGTEHLDGAPERLPDDPAAAVVRAVAARLIGDGLPDAAEERLAALERSLPDGAFLASFGLLPGRTTEAVRVNVGWPLPLAELEPWLATAGWPGARASLARAVELAEGSGAELSLSVDVGARLLPTLGFELFFHHQPGHSRPFHAMLDRLVRARLCSGEQRAAVLGWPGAVHEEAGWPAELTAPLPRSRGSVVRTVNHLKVAIGRDGALGAKAYLVFGHRWVGA